MDTHLACSQRSQNVNPGPFPCGSSYITPASSPGPLKFSVAVKVLATSLLKSLLQTLTFMSSTMCKDVLFACLLSVVGFVFPLGYYIQISFAQSILVPYITFQLTDSSSLVWCQLTYLLPKLDVFAKCTQGNPPLPYLEHFHTL